MSDPINMPGKFVQSLDFFSDTFKQMILPKVLPDQNGRLADLNEKLVLVEPEFDIFSSCVIGFSEQSLNLIFDEGNLKIYHLKHVIDLVGKLADFFGEDDNGESGIDGEKITELMAWEDIDQVSVIRLWENALNKNYQVALHFSLADNEITFLLSNNLN